MTAGWYEVPPAPVKQWFARAAASLALAQTAVLVASALCAWWEARSAAHDVAAAVERHPQLASHAAEATAIVASTYDDMILYSVAMAPLFLAGGLWLLRGRSLPSRIVAISVAAVATVCCIGNACFTDYTTQSETTDALMQSAPPTSWLGDAVALVADGWLLTPVVSMLVVILLALQISRDRTPDPGVTILIG